ncbi:hypothetical protein PIB30_099520, partial [Stylosanthes scabra]|nr:hypothetical protein [Stylosanthes scabra]
GVMRYVGGEVFLIEDNDSDFWCVFVAEEEVVRVGHDKSDIAALWYKDPAIEDPSIGLKMFLDDKDALEMCRIAAVRGHVEMFVVHQDGPEEGFPEIGYVDVGGDPHQGNGEDGQNEEGGGDGEPEPEGQNEEGGAGEGSLNGQIEEGGDAEAPPDGQNEEGGDAEAPPNWRNQDLGDVEAPPNGQIEALVVEAAASIDEGGVTASDQVAPMCEAGLGSGEAESNLEGDQNGEGECANGENDVGEVDTGSEEHGHVNEAEIGAGPGSEDSDSDDSEYVPSADDVDSADDVHFTDSEEEFDFDDSFFGIQTEAGEKAGDGKGKRVVNEEFSDAGEDSDELEDGHAVGCYDREGGEEEDSEGDRIVFPVHKAKQNMADKRKAPVVASSSQPPPTTAISNQIPKRACRGRARVATKAAPNLQSEASKPTKKSTTRPKAISASQPTNTSQKLTAKPSRKPSSSQPVGSRPRFCVRHVGGPHVSPNKLRQMAKLPPRAWGNL